MSLHYTLLGRHYVPLLDSYVSILSPPLHTPRLPLCPSTTPRFPFCPSTTLSYMSHSVPPLRSDICLILSLHYALLYISLCPYHALLCPHYIPPLRSPVSTFCPSTTLAYVSIMSLHYIPSCPITATPYFSSLVLINLLSLSLTSMCPIGPLFSPLHPVIFPLFSPSAILS